MHKRMLSSLNGITVEPEQSKSITYQANRFWLTIAATSLVAIMLQLYRANLSIQFLKPIPKTLLFGMLHKCEK